MEVALKEVTPGNGFLFEGFEERAKQIEAEFASQLQLLQQQVLTLFEQQKQLETKHQEEEKERQQRAGTEPHSAAAPETSSAKQPKGFLPPLLPLIRWNDCSIIYSAIPLTCTYLHTTGAATVIVKGTHSFEAEEIDELPFNEGQTFTAYQIEVSILLSDLF